MVIPPTALFYRRNWKMGNLLAFVVKPFGKLKEMRASMCFSTTNLHTKGLDGSDIKFSDLFVCYDDVIAKQAVR